MSLVKKLQPGGSIDNDALNTALNTELATFNLKSKDERKVRDALVQLRDFAASKGNTFTADELAKKYTVSGEGSEKFQGSPDEIRSNWLTGKLKIKDEQDAMSVAAAIYGNASKSLQGSTSNTPIAKEQLGISNLGTYVTDTVYGTPEAFKEDFGKITSDEERKKRVLDYASRNISSYLESAETNKDKADYKDIESAKAIQAAIATGDWDAFKMASYKVKWNPNEFLLKEEDKERIAAENTMKEQQASKTNLTNLGFSPELADALVTTGFKTASKLKLPEGTRPEVLPALEQFLKNKGAIVLENAGGQQRVMGVNGQLIDVTGEEFNQFNPLSGIAWKHDPTTGAFSFTKSAYTLPDYGNVGVGVQGKIPGYEGWKITGWSGTDETPAGGRDYTKHLVLENNGTKVYLNKDEQGKYRFKDGTELETSGEIGNLKLTGLTGARTNIAKFDQLYPKLYDAQLKVPEGYNHTGDLAKVREAVKLKEVGDVKGMTGQAATRLISALMYNPNLRNNPALKSEIMTLLGDYHDLLSGYVQGQAATNPVDTYKFKAGGIFKFQSGGASKKLDDYIKRMQQNPTISAGETAPTKVTDIKGTWKDMGSAEKNLRKLSIAGTVGSFVPVYGAIGAGVTLGADIAADIAKDGFQASDILNWNTAANVGFVALSAIGLGGVKALVQAGKAVKGGASIAKTAAKAGKYKSALALSVEETKALNKVVKLADRVGAKTPEQLLAKVNQIKAITPSTKTAAKFAENTKILEDGLDVLNMVSKSTTPILGSVRAGQIASAIGKGTSKTLKALGSKPVRTGLRVAGMAPGLMALPGTAATWVTKGFEYTKPEDIKSIAMAGSIGRSWVKDIQGANAITRQATNAVTGADKTVLTLGNEKVTINKAIELPKEVGRVKGLAKGKFSKENLAKTNEAEFTKYKEKLASAAKEEGVILKKEEIDALKPTDIEVAYSSPTGVYTLGAAPKVTGKGRTVDVRDYNLAKKYLGQSEETAKAVVKGRVKKPLTAEQKEELKTLRDTKVQSKSAELTNKQIKEEIKSRKAVIAKSKKNQVNEKILAKREKQLKEYIEKYKQIASKKDGGILKFQYPSKPIYKIDLPEYEVTATNLRPALKSLGYTVPKIGLNDAVNKYVPFKPVGTEVKKETKKETDITSDVNQKPGIFKSFGEQIKGSINPTSVANLAMYISTVAANQKIGQAQRRAVADSLYNLPTMPQNYLRIDKPSTLLADKQAAGLRSQAGRIARSVSDMDKGRGVQLQGEAQAANVVAQGQQADLTRMDKLRGMQLENKAQVDQANTNILGKNRALTAEAAKNLHLINTNQYNAQNTAFGNFVRAAERNVGINKYKSTLDDYWKLSNDSALKAQSEAYSKEASEEGRKAAENLYNEAKATYKGTDYAKTFEESSEYTKWQQRITDLGKQLELAMEPLRKKQSWLQLYQPMLFMKAGGRLSREDRIAIDRAKAHNVRRMKDTEMMYKAIMHNNEMLQKALIKVFK